MTIKETEELTGLPRTNIRYYEQEGLISPARSENRYRDYSRADVDTLLRVRLLRSLDMPLDEIRELLQGGDFTAALRRNLGRLEEKSLSISRAREMTKALLEQGARLDTLDAKVYLSALEAPREAGAAKLCLPWQRFWAWGTDALIVDYLTNLLLAPFGVPVWLDFVLSLGVLFLFVSACLHLFATTPGKAIFGIRVTDLEERNLSFWDAMERTWICLWEGQGLRLPLVSYYFTFKSYMAVGEKPLSWERDSELTHRDNKPWRYVLMALVWVGILILVLGGAL